MICFIIHKWRALKFRLFGRTFVGYEYKSGWKKPMKAYKTRCPDHGPFIATPSGWSHFLLCPECWDERERAIGEKIMDEERRLKHLRDMGLIK